MAYMRTVLDIAEKGADGVPVPFLKTAVGSASQILKVMEVRTTLIWS
jgi:hypothetical protein